MVYQNNRVRLCYKIPCGFAAKMRLFYVLLLFCFISCKPQNSLVAEYVNLIGQSVPDTYSFEPKPEFLPQSRLARSPHENGNIYRKHTVINSIKGTETFITLVADDSALIQSCYITFSFGDFVDSRNCYKKIRKYLVKENWQFQGNIGRYKLENGELYLKNGMYIGIYEPIYFSTPIGISNSRENFILEGFCY